MIDGNSKTTLKELVVDFLQSKPGEPYKSRDIAEELKSAHPQRFQTKETAQLAAEIGAHSPKWIGQVPGLNRSEETPRLLWWDGCESQEAIIPPSLSGTTDSSSELELYPLLARFLISCPRTIYPKRIDEKKSSNSFGKDGNKWLHPDMVGLEDLTTGWKYELKDWVARTGARQAKLWSFEVKKVITRSTVRKDYFQTVSNSTWANYGYLVALEIKEEVISELILLNELHGIGILQLNQNEPEASVIRIQARERPEVDWRVCNRIASENSHFQDFVRLIAQFYDTRTTHRNQWDIPAD